MKLRMKFVLGSCAILMLGAAVKAQDVTAVAGAGGTAIVAPAAPAGPNLFTMLLPPPEMKERCRQKLCQCEIVKLLRASLAPASAATGGIIPVGNCCPTIKKEDLAKPATSSEGAAARVKKDAEEAAARREAVRYLGTVDCRYWPEAEEALINALRADKIECVRYEAAVVLQRGCCCTKKIAKALTDCIEGSDKDGNPAERSARVQDAAAMALSMCVFETKVDPKTIDPIKTKPQARVDPKEYYREVESMPNETVYGGARKALEKRNNINSTQVLSQPHRAASQGLIGIFSHAVESSADVTPAANAAPREPQFVASVPAQPQRRGLLYKMFPSNTDEPVAMSSPAPRSLATTQPIAAQPAAQPVTIAQPQRAPVANEIRPTGFMNAPGHGTMTEEPMFSTAGPSAPPYASRTIPIPTPAPAPLPPMPPMPTSSNSSNRPEQGLLGFVITEDAPARR